MNKSMEKAEDAGPGYIVRSHGFSACIINPDGSGTDTVYANMSMFADGSCHIECYVDGIRVLSKNIGTEDLMLFQTRDGDSSITAEHVIQKVSITDVDCSGVMLRMTLGRPRTRKGASCYTVYVDNIKGIDGIMPEDRIDIVLILRRNGLDCRIPYMSDGQEAEVCASVKAMRMRLILYGCISAC